MEEINGKIIIKICLEFSLDSTEWHSDTFLWNGNEQIPQKHE